MQSIPPPCAAERQPYGLTGLVLEPNQREINQNAFQISWDPWRSYEDPIIHFYLPSLPLWCESSFQLIYSTWYGSFRREAADQEGTAQRHHLAGRLGDVWTPFKGGLKQAGRWVIKWLDGWKNLEGSAGIYRWLSFTPGCTSQQQAGRTKMTTSRPIDLFWAQLQWQWLKCQPSMQLLCPKKGCKFQANLGKFRDKTHHFPGLHKSSRNSSCCTESIVWQVSAMSHAAEGKN